MAAAHTGADTGAGTRPTTGPPPSHGARTTAALGGLRLIGAALLGTNAGIHAYLWDAGYRTIPTIGTLFLLDVIAASVLTLAVLAVPRRMVVIAAALGALLEVGTVAGLLISTEHELFGFIESSKATLYWPSAWTEIAGAVVLAGLAVVAARLARRTSSAPWW